MSQPAPLHDRLVAFLSFGDHAIGDLSVVCATPLPEVAKALERGECFRRVALVRGMGWALDRSRITDAQIREALVLCGVTKPAEQRSAPVRPKAKKPKAEARIDVEPWPIPHPIDRPTIVVQTVSPADAAAMLARNHDNRKLRGAHVAWLCRLIQQGDWKLSHQGIAFSTAGRLIDGQHRLHAVIAADRAIELAVSYGWPDEAFATIDCGIVRLAQDRLRLHPDGGWNARAIQLLNSIRRFYLGQRLKATNEEMLALWKAHSAGIEMVERHFPAMILYLTRPPVFAALVLAHHRDAVTATAAAEELRTGQGPADSVVIALRRWLLNGAQSDPFAVYTRSHEALLAYQAASA